MAELRQILDGEYVRVRKTGSIGKCWGPTIQDITVYFVELRNGRIIRYERREISPWPMGDAPGATKEGT